MSANNQSVDDVHEVINNWFWYSETRDLRELSEIVVEMYGAPTSIRKWKNITKKELPKQASYDFYIGADWAARKLMEKNT